MGNAARKARKRAGEKLPPKPAKVPTGKLPKASNGLPVLDRHALEVALSMARRQWETRW